MPSTLPSWPSCCTCRSNAWIRVVKTWNRPRRVRAANILFRSLLDYGCSTSTNDIKMPQDAHEATRQGKVAKAARQERCSAATVPAIISQENDADIITALRRGSALPKNFIGIMSRAIWMLRRAARTAKDSLWQKRRPRCTRKELLPQLLLDIVVVAGDGNCLFRSFSHQLFGCETHHEYVRSCAVDYMREHAEDFQGFFAPKELVTALSLVCVPSV